MGFLHLGWESATFEDDGGAKPLADASPLWAAVGAAVDLRRPGLPTVQRVLGWHPLHVAAMAGDTGLIARLVEQFRCDLRVKSINSWTPLHYAAAYNQARAGCDAAPAAAAAAAAAAAVVLRPALAPLPAPPPLLLCCRHRCGGCQPGTRSPLACNCGHAGAGDRGAGQPGVRGGRAGCSGVHAAARGRRRGPPGGDRGARAPGLQLARCGPGGGALLLAGRARQAVGQLAAVLLLWCRCRCCCCCCCRTLRACAGTLIASPPRWLLPHAVTDRDGCTPLYCAAAWNRVEAVRLLERLQCPPTLRSLEGRTAVHVAAEQVRARGWACEAGL